MPSRSTWGTAAIAGACVALIGAVGVVYARDSSASGTPAATSAISSSPGPRAPSWTLTDQNGKRVSSAQLAGKVQVVSFLFPYCTTYCPTTARSMAQLEDQLKGTKLANRVQIVAFNVDPTGADRATMRAFWTEFGGNPADPSVSFLTGTAAQIRHVVTDGYKVYYQKETEAQKAQQIAAAKKAGTYVAEPTVPNPVASKAKVTYDIVHNDVMEIVGPDGRIDRVFDDAASVPAPTLLAAVRTAAQGSGG